MATEVINTTFQFKRGSILAWEKVNPVLAPGEPGWALDAHILKIGDGKTPWKDLPLATDNCVFNAQTAAEFPSIGSANVIYKAEAEKRLYQWNNFTEEYEVIGGGDEPINIDRLVQDEGTYLVLYGGSASDNI